MLKKITALLLAISILGSIQACSMPDAIFGDDAFRKEEETGAVAALDIYSFDLMLDGEKYELPINFSALSSKGWSIQEPAPAEEGDTTAQEEQTPAYTAESTLEPDAYSDYVPVEKMGLVLGVKFWNPDRSAAPLTSCRVVGLRLDPSYGKQPPFSIHEHEMGVGSPYEKVIDLCGKPSYIMNNLPTGELQSINNVKFFDTDEPTSPTLIYKLDDHSQFIFTMNGTEGTEKAVVSLVMENNAEKEEEYDYNKEIRYKPEAIDLYKGPNLLGKTFSEFSFKYDGNLYTLPIPVRKLLDDGWQFVRGYGERVPPGTTADGVIMRKGNTAITLKVHNYDMKYALTAVNCYAISLDAALTGPNVDILLSKGITLGSTEKELVAAFGKEYAKTHAVPERTTNEEAGEGGEKQPVTINVGETDKYEFADMPGVYIEKNVGEEFTVYSYVMPDDVPTVTLPVSITDIGDTGAALLGDVRKHIDVYVDNSNGLVTRFYLQNCPEYIVDEAKIIEQQMEEARKKEHEEWLKQQEEQESSNG